MLQEKLAQYKVVLASKSPRRQQIFKELGIPFEIQLKEVKEVYPSHLVAAEITDYLAELKATAFKDSLHDNRLVITSDTIVWLDDKALGKPVDEEHAKEMLQKISGKKHQVISSISLTHQDFQKTFHDITEVYFKDLTSEEINYYVQKYQPYDKAGSYGIQEWIGYIGIEKIEGSYFNVMGLPVHKLYKELMQL
ncbi:Maf-like protein [Polaribacter pacificus]|uniref:dTTP/UTP pyrophosphatase n=1 Tax=Polaribacter pacificus TaxID=1775173 RepID=A0A917ME97_9FLAO|nr:Maf-like protein [Polaribacter pacificus]GGG98194.1 Maf-like protein [Polaribacter pacificus]